jgi:hypothetical protein
LETRVCLPRLSSSSSSMRYRESRSSW